MTRILEQEPRTSLPGFGRALDDYFIPTIEGNEDDGIWEWFPHAIEDTCFSEPVSLRERRMLEFINQITDKLQWYYKVFDATVVAKWRTEAVVYSPQLKDEYLTAPMFDYCIQELRDKAEYHQSSMLVAVLDCDLAVVKSDEIVPDSLHQGLRQAVRVLEDVPEHHKDWHPGSDKKVLDLLHPSLFPLIHGVSRAKPRGTVPIARCAQYCGDGETVDPVFADQPSWEEPSNPSLEGWGSFQWLPSEVRFADDGKPTITSYVNNLHPEKHQSLYPILERFVDAAIPLWDECLSWFRPRLRLERIYGSDEDFGPPPEHVTYAPLPEEEIPNPSYREWFKEHRVLKHTAVLPFCNRQDQASSPIHKPVNLKQNYAKSGLQIIFKLAGIYLTPEKPEYEGGSWHVEGALNEHICATALYYYDEENITPSRLAFRQKLNAYDMRYYVHQYEWESTEQFYGVKQDGPPIQLLGSVLTRSGRLLSFPNNLQHRVEPFRLDDTTRPGHRKILAMFLVDPHIRILSTANVPPQRVDWWAEEVRRVPPFDRLPGEIYNQITDHVHGFPLTWEEALTARQALMNERGALVELRNDENEMH
ncbi:hypothetical protein FE257_009685 [Aspergillus nanangensis]|uniref:Uncharacterized protein n=1 Tax=Aspergillus nanangensis TaxID=2582783 RepID=A0AAD4CLE3_ASPNN|nr:hypothetical protein FE257_009685 [Aspergillus nanangensis]